jgi:hypothetical protein
MRLRRTLADLVFRHHVTAGIVEISAKGTKLAFVNADIRRIQMRVDIIERDILVVPLADPVCQPTKREEISTCLETEPILESKAMPCRRFLFDFT